MGKWKGAWFLVKSELLRARWKSIIPIVFAGYMLLFMVPLFENALNGNDSSFAYWAIDLYALLLFPCLGLMVTQPYFYWRTDTYTKKLEVWRTLPIPFKQIVLGKFLLYLTISIPAMILFFTGFYFAVHAMNPQFELGAFLQFALFWIVYTTIAGFGYLYVELGYKGKIYFWYCLILSFAALGGLIAVFAWTKESILLNSYLTVLNGGWWLPLAAIAVAAAGIPLGLGSIEKKLRKRNLAK
ncbi:ABC transporter permease [Paenibacillus sp. LHD-117]|uniref:ABC transporter permease n=1 Tax=Paenibacillus sp. LHD-117 TaxID=3071412 RepID=UPI0027E1394E|nr:ABC transporter permease [Paenibacillus sp. LHD-117]MDQ6421373.1 ABC transporter permease [Paenibacillus sp. LHD-117]